MYQDHETGKKGEEIACGYLLRNGIQVIERNYKCKMGEIDIIAKDKKELVFIEVKTRGQLLYGVPSEAVGKQKKQHIYRVAEYFLMKNHLEEAFCRLDVIEVYLYKHSYKINHIKNSIFERPPKRIFKKWNEEDRFEQ